jgi:malonyl CoA-acyl carrier protein transacylase
MTFETPTALLFPGQGSQQADMRDLVAEAAPELLDHCIELVGEDPFARVDDSTRFAQPAIFCASVAGWARAGIDPGDLHAVAGHSLGEISALVAARALDAHAGLELVVARGAAMATAGERDGGGTMLALLGASAEAAEQLAADNGVTVANDNAPGQIVLSGPTDAIQAVAAEARELGLRAMELGVAGAFHSPMMEAAVPAFEAALADASFEPPAAPVVSCLTGAPISDPRRDLLDGLTRPVRWTRTLHALADLGVTRFVDAGPGKVLAKLTRRNLPNAESLTLADLMEPARG